MTMPHSSVPGGAPVMAAPAPLVLPGLSMADEALPPSDLSGPGPGQLNPCAKSIAEHLLDETATALISGDFDAFARFIALPLTVETFAGQSLLETDEDLRRTFFAAHKHYRDLGATKIPRYVLSAGFDDPDTVQSTSMGRVVARGGLDQEPTLVFMRLERDQDGWRARSLQYALPEDNALNAVFQPQPCTSETNGA